MHDIQFFFFVNGYTFNTFVQLIKCHRCSFKEKLWCFWKKNVSTFLYKQYEFHFWRIWHVPFDTLSFFFRSLRANVCKCVHFFFFSSFHMNSFHLAIFIPFLFMVFMLITSMSHRMNKNWNSVDITHFGEAESKNEMVEIRIESEKKKNQKRMG